MKKQLTILFALVFINTNGLFAQTDAALISNLLADIETMQFKQDGEFYTGMFPGYRRCAGFPHNYQPDNNIFFTAITAFTLNKLTPHLSNDDKATAIRISKNATAAYPHYRNPNGKPYYSFWPVNAPILPHAFFINRLTGVLAQGDDADDSVMILLASANNDNDNTALKERLIAVSNLKKRKINSTFKKYRDIPAYSTYLGEKMHPDFDLAVQCNILYFNFEKKLPLVKEDSATIYLITDMLNNRTYMKRPVYISPSYVKPAILIYHVARLIEAFKIAELQLYRDQLIDDANKLLAKATNIMERIILRTSLLRLGAEVSELTINSLADFEKTDQDHFVFFQARAAFAQPTPVKQILLHWNYLIYHFYSAAYNKALWLEYLVLKNNQKLQQKK
ncbi:MAG: hypothetical protein IPO01_13280 [Chitinophagaceae bacterium]|nr:hypothetical protein [Chitinophagaceae bacterium]